MLFVYILFYILVLYLFFIIVVCYYFFFMCLFILNIQMNLLTVSQSYAQEFCDIMLLVAEQ
jgi:hypothetical protein